jgi:hypothetical protein
MALRDILRRRAVAVASKADMTSWAEFNAVHYELINSLATQHRLPANYPFHYEISNGGLASYGPNTVDIYGSAATYVDRILRGCADTNKGSLRDCIVEYSASEPDDCGESRSVQFEDGLYIRSDVCRAVRASALCIR